MKNILKIFSLLKLSNDAPTGLVSIGIKRGKLASKKKSNTTNESIDSVLNILYPKYIKTPTLGQKFY